LPFCCAFFFYVLSSSGAVQEGSAHFIAELHIQQVRKLVLEMIQRLPANDLLKPYAKASLTLPKSVNSFFHGFFVLFFYQ
jgi:hypothetical protein